MELTLKDYKMEEHYKMINNLDISSSYKENNLGHILYDTVIKYQPYKIIEFGCLYGYSTICMALALKNIGKGKIYCYDIWEDYQYKHSTFHQTKNNVIKYKVEDYVEFKKINFYDWLTNPESFDLMHLDISNTGDIIEKLYDVLSPCERVIFEGGSIERDNVEWMKKYNATSINSIKQKVKYQVINNNFPSISIFTK